MFEELPGPPRAVINIKKSAECPEPLTVMNSLHIQMKETFILCTNIILSELNCSKNLNCY